MKILRWLVVLVALALLAPALSFAQESANNARVPAPPAALGERFTIVLEVTAPAGATVEIDPLAPGWDGVEVLEQRSAEVSTVPGDREHHRLELTAAAFLPGDREIKPTVLVTNGGAVETRELGPVSLDVPSSLSADAPLQLTGTPQPGPISGAASPFFLPALGVAAIVVLVTLFVGGRWLWRHRPRRRPRPVVPEPESHPLPLGQLPGTTELFRDPVAAYRAMSRVVRQALVNEYGVPALSLTTTELQARLQRDEVDRWQARLVTGLLQNCDLVIYAGFQPPRERREADLGMAREIMDGLA